MDIEKIKAQRNIMLFIIIATFITTILDVLIVKTHTFVNYIVLNFFEWFMFGVGWYAGKGHWRFWKSAKTHK